MKYECKGVKYVGFFQMLSAEFSKIFSNKPLIISTIAVLLFPVMYSVALLSSTMEPTDNIDNLPVAVVNMDEGASMGEDEIQAGDDLVNELQEEQVLDFQFVDQAEANEGLENGDYYMTVEIPSDFSSRATTVMDENPEQTELIYTQNEGLSHMASQVTDAAITEIMEGLSEQITATYVTQMFDQLGDVSDGFTEAADGSGEINDGTEDLIAWTSEMLTSLVGESDEITRLSDGDRKSVV